MPAQMDANENKRRMAMIAVSAVVLVAMVAAIGVGVSEGLKKSGDSGVVTTNKAITDLCQTTDYRHTCEESLAASESSETSDPIQLIQTAFHVAVEEIQSAVANSTTIKHAYDDPRTAGAVQTCQEVMNYAIGDLDKSINQMGQIHLDQIEEFVGNLKIWLSGAINYQETCLDAFENTTGDASTSMKKLLNISREMTSNGLAMASEVSTFLTTFNLTTDFNLTALQLKRRLLSDDDQDAGRLLLAADVKPDVVVAKDGSGKYKTVNEALGDVPLHGNKTFVIRIKEGVYDEKVQVGASMKNVVFLGDGPTKTKITGKQSFAEGTPSYKTATVAIMGEGFMAKDIGFENTAGAGKGAAVALLVQSDRSIFQNCRIDGHTNSLYAINYRQFFTNCTVSGAVDFITGDALAVFQNCRLLIRPPNPDGEPGDCFVTAQTRSDKREPSGFVLQNCTVAADADYLPVKDKTRSYLGRPKKEYSSAVFMESQMDDVIEAAGWAPFRGSLGKDTCFYAEYKNRGPGSKQDGRVKWPGIQQLDSNKVEEFTAAKFLGGDTWVKPAGVPYSSGLMNI